MSAVSLTTLGKSWAPRAVRSPPAWKDAVRLKDAVRFKGAARFAELVRRSMIAVPNKLERCTALGTTRACTEREMCGACKGPKCPDSALIFPGMALKLTKNHKNSDLPVQKSDAGGPRYCYLRQAVPGLY
eukprot:3683133-Rhodomonas_salina.2